MKHLKDEFDRLTFKEIIMYSLTIVCMTAAIVSIFLSMYIEPRGEIHASVLTYFGISMGFCGSVFGIETAYNYKLKEFKSQITQMMNQRQPDPA